MASGHDPLVIMLERPGWRSIIDSFTKKYLRHGYVCGRHKIASREEADALWGLLGGRVAPEPGRSISAERLDRALQESAVALTLEEVLHRAAGGPLVPRPVVRDAERLAWEEALYTAKQIAEEEGEIQVFADWIACDERYLRSVWRSERTHFLGMWRFCVRTYRLLTDGISTPDSLPVIASKATGSPHGLDANTSTSRLVLRFLIWKREGQARGVQSAEDRARTWRDWGVEVDDLSSVVVASGIVDGHPLIRTAYENDDHICLSLYQVRVIDRVSISSDAIWAVENPAVFRDLHHRLRGQPGQRPPLVLTSGNPSLAVQFLLDRLMQSGEGKIPTMFYSGDNDPRGLELLAFWRSRYPGRVQAWGMASGDGLAPVEPGDSTLWQEDLIEHLWDSMCAVSAAAYRIG